MRKKGEAFSLCGAGKVGIALSFQLFRIGYQPRLVWNRSPEKLIKAVQLVPFNKSTTTIKDIHNPGNWLIIAVSESAITRVARDLAALDVDWSGVKVFHTSGFYAADVLHPLRARGAKTGALHPVISVPSAVQGKISLALATYTCQGYLAPELLKLVARIGGKGFRVSVEQKKVIHVAAVLLNNYLMATIAGLRELGEQVELESVTNHQILDPIIQQTLRKAWTQNIDETITGPIARGDRKTVAGHLEALADFPGLQNIYRTLARNLCQRLAAKVDYAVDMFEGLFDQ